MKLFTDVAAIDKAIKSIATRGKKLQSDMHQVACSVLDHYGHNEDSRVVLRLIDAMPEMSRKNALCQWFEAFTCIKFERVKDDNGKMTLAASKDARKKHRLGEAMDTPFWKMKGNEGEVYQPLDLPARINILIKAIERDAVKAKDAGKKPQDHKAELKALRDLAKGYAVAEA